MHNKNSKCGVILQKIKALRWWAFFSVLKFSQKSLFEHTRREEKNNDSKSEPGIYMVGIHYTVCAVFVHILLEADAMTCVSSKIVTRSRMVVSSKPFFVLGENLVKIVERAS